MISLAFFSRFVKRYFSILLVFCSLSLTAQSDIKFGWSNENACSSFESEGTISHEDLIDLPCFQVCENVIANYWVEGLANYEAPYSINWSVIGGDIINQPNPSFITVQWNTNSSASEISVEIEIETGEVYVFSFCVEVQQAPVASFEISPEPDRTIFCFEQELFFINKSTPNPGGQIISYYWDFGDGNSSSQFEPSHIYDAPGTYEVVLSIRNECYCIDTYSMEIEVVEWGNPIEIICPTLTCENAIETYTALADCEFHWSVIGGTILNNTENQAEVQIQWDNVDESGFGWVMLETEACDGCPMPTLVKVPVILEQGHIKGEDVICIDKQYRYSLPQWPATEFNWVLLDDNGVDYSQFLVYVDQRNEIIISPDSNLQAGNYELKAIYNNTLKQCSGQASLEISILNAPHEIIGPKEVCANDVFTFQTQDPNINTEWTLTNELGEFLDSLVNDEYISKISEPGSYILTANSPNRCNGTGFIFKVNELAQTPIGDFILPDEVCPNFPYEITFINFDTNLDLNEYEIEWTVENGRLIESDAYEAEVIFDENPAGDYRLSLSYKQKNKPYCSSEPLFSDIILPVSVDTEIEAFNPVSNITISTNIFCTSSETSFRVDDLSADEYNWTIVPANFGNIVQGQDSPEITVLWNEISNSSIGYVELEIRKCTERFTINAFEVDLIESPTISWNPPSLICAEEPFDIIFSSTPNIQSYDSISLDLGNGQVFTNPSVVSPGVYAFNNISYDNILSANLNYTMQLVVSDPNACYHPAIATANIGVLAAPIATISPNNFKNMFCDLAGLINSNIILTATEQGGIIQTTGYQWYLNDINNPIPGATGPTHQAIQFGDYFVEITGTNDCSGISQVYSIGQMICNGGSNGPGQGNNCQEAAGISTAIWATCNTVEASLNVSSTPDTIIWSAYPSDGINLTSTTNLNAVFEVTKPGSYLIMAKVLWDNCGGVEVHNNVVIDYQPILNYEVLCNLNTNDFEVVLYNNSAFISGLAPQQTTFYVNNTPYTYPGNHDKHSIVLPSGTHTLGLDINSPGNPVCSLGPITIDLNLPDASFSLPTETCEGDVVVLSPNNIDPNNKYEWEFNLTSNLNTIVEATLLEENNKKVTLYVTDRYGCTVSHTEFIDVNKADHSDYDIIRLPDTTCIGETITLSFLKGNILPPLGTTYQWYFNEVAITGANSPTYTTSISGNYGLEITSAEGCSERIDPISILFDPLPKPKIKGPNLAVCAGTKFDLEGSSNNKNLSRRWLREGIELYPLSPSTPWILEDLDEPTPGTYTYSLEVGDSALGECTNTAFFTVEILPKPTENDIQLSYQVTCNPFEVIATVTNPDPNGQYNWSNGTHGTQTSVNHSGVLGLHYTNASGCSVWKSIEIPKHPEELIWVFPSGCVDNCEDISMNYHYLIGPLPYIDRYAWLFNDTGNMYSGIVSPYYLNYQGDVQLYLGKNIFDAYCEVYSKPLQLTTNQEACNPCNEELIRFDVLNIQQGTNYPFLSYELSLQIANTMGAPLALELYSPDGIYIPGNINIGAGQTIVVPIDFIPDAGFVGGNSDLSIRIMHNGRAFCFYEHTINFPISIAPPLESSAEMIVVPNPAVESTEIRFKFHETNKLMLKLYSLSGIKLIEKQVSYSQGSLHLDLSLLASGTYIIVMEDDSGTRLQQHIIKK